MSLQRTISITCDFPTACAKTFGPKSDKVGEAQREARDAGWYLGENEKAYCPEHVAALGIRTRGGA